MISTINDLKDFSEYDLLVEKSINGTIFHTRKYLLLKKVIKVLCIWDGQKIFALFPLYGWENKNYKQLPIEIPYGGVVVIQKIQGRRDLDKLRNCYDLILKCLINLYTQIDFSIIPYNADVFPFIEAGFVPEVRYTYVLDLRDTRESILMKMSSNRRRDYKKSLKHLLFLEVCNSKIEINKLLFWVDDNEMKDRLQREMKELMEINRGNVISIYNDRHMLIGQLFLCWDWECAYVQNIFIEKQFAEYGISTRLYIEAIWYAKEILHLNRFDFNGSVLGGVEHYYRTFGGKQKLYFNLHWNKNHDELRKIDFYDYR